MSRAGIMLCVVKCAPLLFTFSSLFSVDDTTTLAGRIEINCHDMTAGGPERMWWDICDETKKSGEDELLPKWMKLNDVENWKLRSFLWHMWKKKGGKNEEEKIPIKLERTLSHRVTSKDWKEITFIAIAINISDNDDNFAHMYMQRTASWPN